MTKIELLCPTCGAADMTRDACARWNVETGDWELSATYDTMTCDSCGDETYECAEIDPDTLPEEGSDEWLALCSVATAKPSSRRSLTEKYVVWKEQTDAG